MNDVIVLDTSEDEDYFEEEDPLGEITAQGKSTKYATGEDGTYHPIAREINIPELRVPLSQFSGPMTFGSSFAEMLDQDAQPREESTIDTYVPEIEHNSDKGRSDDEVHRSLLERMGITDEGLHLMSARARKRQRSRERKHRTDPNKSSYDEKGKGREPGTRPEETEQIRLDREFAEKEQSRIYEGEGAKEPRRAKTKSETHASEKSFPRKNAKKKTRDHLGLTQWIETPASTPGARAPEASPARALNQLPSGGYLAQTWKSDKGQKRKAKHRISKHTKRRRDKKEEDLRKWNERSDLSDDAVGGGGPPDGSSSSDSSDSDGSGSSSESDNDSVTNNPQSDSDTTSESSEEDSGRDHRKLSSKSKTLLAKTIKYPEPSAYDGRAHLETFETFVFEFTNWIKVNNLPEKYQMMVMKRFLTDKAGHHYMTFAAVNLRKWTVDNYLRALFNHCFPIHFRSQMRSKFNSCTQGG